MSRNTTNDVPPDILDNEEDDETVALESSSDVEFDLEVNPVSAGKLDALLAEAYATPKDVIAKAAKAMSD